MSNALWWLPSLKAEGVVRDPVGPGRFASIDPEDIAAVAAVTLTQEGHGGQIYTLTGSELQTVAEQVEILASVLGREIIYIETTPEEAAKEALARGTDKAMVDASLPSTPTWLAEGAAFAQVLSHTGILEAIQERVRFARARFGHYDVIDFVVVLIGYAISGEPTLTSLHMSRCQEVYPRNARNATVFRHFLAHFPDILANEWQGLAKKRKGERKKRALRCHATL